MTRHNIDAPLIELPLFLTPVACGFPSPAQDYIEQTIDLNQLCVEHPAATFFVRAAGDSMLGAGIHDGDLLVVDRALEAAPGRIIIAALDGELTVKRLENREGRLLLVPANPDYPEIDLTGREGFEVWGVVCHVIHKV